RSNRIEQQDANEAVQALQSTYKLRLGESEYSGPEPAPLQTKISKLVAIHRGQPEADIPDKTLYLLLRLRMALQFNGRTWFGVHPLVVNILKEIGSIGYDEGGGTDLGGN